MSKSDAEGLRIVTKSIGLVLCGCAVANLLGYAEPDFMPSLILAILGLATLTYSESFVDPEDHNTKTKGD
jgi:hypothetical protein